MREGIVKLVSRRRPFPKMPWQKQKQTKTKKDIERLQNQKQIKVNKTKHRKIKTELNEPYYRY